MDVEVTVSNYRCFSDTPVRFALKKGLQAFVGVNNSGKSCLLRLFYELRNVFVDMSAQDAVFACLTGPSRPFGVMPLVRDTNEIFCDRNDRDLLVGFEMNIGPVGDCPAPSRFEVLIPHGTNTWSAKIYAGGTPISRTDLGSRYEAGDLRVVDRSGTALVALTPVAELGKVLSRMLYLGPFRNAVNVGGSGDYYDIQIGQPFITNWRILKTGYQKKQSEATYKLTDDIRRIFGFESLDINASDDGQNLQLMIDGKTYKQTEIGSGLIQFILVLVNAAIRSPSYILIDEPELNLHPSLQVDFLTTLASYAQYGVLFATHEIWSCSCCLGQGLSPVRLVDGWPGGPRFHGYAGARRILR